MCLFEYLFSVLWGYLPRIGVVSHMVVLNRTTNCFPLEQNYFTVPTVYENCNFPTFSPTFIFSVLNVAILTVVLTCIYLVINAH